MKQLDSLLNFFFQHRNASFQVKYLVYLFRFTAYDHHYKSDANSTAIIP